MGKEPYNIWIQLRNRLDREFNVELSIIQANELRQKLGNDPDVAAFDMAENFIDCDIVGFLEEFNNWKEDELD
jgi:hypothetical protein